MRATVQYLELPPDRRVLAVSDVHGNLGYLKGLLARVDFSPADILILVGDLLEKGPDSLETLRYVIRLAKTHTVYAVAGNCDTLCRDFLRSDGPGDRAVFSYMKFWGDRLELSQMARELGIVIETFEDLPRLRAALPAAFAEEIAWAATLPTVIETPHYRFVHGGIPRETALNELDEWGCTKNDAFVLQGLHFKKWCVVGHWPATLYRADYPCAEPLVSARQRILSIDGGCVLKRDGQLNAVFLPPVPDGNFSWVSYDNLPVREALDGQAPSRGSVNIHWGDNLVSVLEGGDELSLCRHLSTGRELFILNRDLWETPEGTRCQDSTDYELAVSPGDRLSVIAETGRGALVKKDGITGWYRGRLSEKTVDRRNWR